MEFKEGDLVKIKLSERHKWDKEYHNCVFRVMKIDLGMHYISLEDVEDKCNRIVGCFDLSNLEYYGNNVNNEIFNLLRDNNIKSFQAILEDGRIVHLGCLN